MKREVIDLDPNTSISKIAELIKNNKSINWNKLLLSRDLKDTEFFDEFEDIIDWNYLSKVRVLSINFIERYKYFLHFDTLLWYQKNIKEILEIYNEELDETKKSEVKDNLLYTTDIKKDWFIAYNINWVSDPKDNDNSEDGYFLFNYYVIKSKLNYILLKANKLYKVKVYYKDLITPFTTSRFYIIKTIDLKEENFFKKLKLDIYE